MKTRLQQLLTDLYWKRDWLEGELAKRFEDPQTDKMEFEHIRGRLCEIRFCVTRIDMIANAEYGLKRWWTNLAYAIKGLLPIWLVKGE